MPLNFERQTPAESRLENDTKILWGFTHSIGEPPELDAETRLVVELFAEDYIDYGCGKLPGKYILELYQLQQAI
jgi:hypothetical protein